MCFPCSPTHSKQYTCCYLSVCIYIFAITLYIGCVSAVYQWRGAYCAGVMNVSSKGFVVCCVKKRNICCNPCVDSACAHRLEADCQFLQKCPQTVPTATWCCLSVEWQLLHWHNQCFSKMFVLHCNPCIDSARIRRLEADCQFLQKRPNTSCY